MVSCLKDQINATITDNETVAIAKNILLEEIKKVWAGGAGSELAIATLFDPRFRN